PEGAAVGRDPRRPRTAQGHLPQPLDASLGAERPLPIASPAEPLALAFAILIPGAGPRGLDSAPMPPPNLWAVLLAGRPGTRFWRASRRALPKQFLPIAGGRSLLAQTAARLRGVVPWERVIAVTSAEHAGLVQKHLPKLAPENVLAEPEARNTAAAVA